MKKVVSLLLWVVIAGLAYLVYNSVMAPIRFDKEKDVRYHVVVENLKAIRDAQGVYKTVNKEYAANFDSLFTFIDSGKVVITTQRDTTYMEYNKVYRMDMQVEKRIIDTLDIVNAKQYLMEESEFFATLENEDGYRAMQDVPYAEGKVFEMESNTIERNGVKVPVFEARAAKADVLADLDADLVRQEEEAYIGVKGAYISVGSLENASTAGNWDETYDTNKNK